MAIDVSSSKPVSYTPYPGSRRTRPTMSSGTARVTSFPDWPRETEILLGRCLFFQIDKACLDGLQILVKSRISRRSRPLVDRPSPREVGIEQGRIGHTLG